MGICLPSGHVDVTTEAELQSLCVQLHLSPPSSEQVMADLSPDERAMFSAFVHRLTGAEAVHVEPLATLLALRDAWRLWDRPGDDVMPRWAR